MRWVTIVALGLSAASCEPPEEPSTFPARGAMGVCQPGGVDGERALVSRAGEIEAPHAHHIYGWAHALDGDEPVDVRIEIDGVVETVLTADGDRPDLVCKGLHPTGAAGFKTNVDLSEGAEVRIFIDGTGQELTNSPFLLPAEPCGAASTGGPGAGGGC